MLRKYGTKEHSNGFSCNDMGETNGPNQFHSCIQNDINTFNWCAREDRYVLEQHAVLDFHSARSLKQKSTNKHVKPPRQRILIPTPYCCEQCAILFFVLLNTFHLSQLIVSLYKDIYCKTVFILSKNLAKRCHILITARISHFSRNRKKRLSKLFLGNEHKQTKNYGQNYNHGQGCSFTLCVIC